MGFWVLGIMVGCSRVFAQVSGVKCRVASLSLESEVHDSLNGGPGDA